MPRSFVIVFLPFAGHDMRRTYYPVRCFYLAVGVQVCTELITNNAAAALAVPIALSIAKELDVRQYCSSTRSNCETGA